jgi:hypothetical protein
LLLPFDEEPPKTQRSDSSTRVYTAENFCTCIKRIANFHHLPIFPPVYEQSSHRTDLEALHVYAVSAAPLGNTKDINRFRLKIHQAAPPCSTAHDITADLRLSVALDCRDSHICLHSILDITILADRTRVAMEPVPETERMEAFRSSPVPTLRVADSTRADGPFGDNMTQQKPQMPRRSTEPTPLSPTGTVSPLSLPYHSRNTSPYNRGHLRSRSSASALAPVMMRAQSLPGVNGAGQMLQLAQQRPSSPLGSPRRVRTPRKPVDDVFPILPGRALSDKSDGIAESPERSQSPVTGLSPSTIIRTRRPSSPLRVYANALGTTTPSSTASSPSFHTPRFTDTFPGLYNYPGSFNSSSVPSTPTSARSRSPSISSLETIPDSPDAEEAALEAERIAQLKAAADAADGEEAKTRSSLDIPGARGRTLGLTYGSRDKRKRWSVCGAERRGDLETVWED